jgi:alpha-maltose-1-phosphate synthase
MSEVDGAGLHVWMPTIRGGSGGDVFVERLVEGLRSVGVKVTVDWFNPRFEFAPALLRIRRPPPGVNIIHANALSAFASAGHGLPLVVTEHHYVQDPVYRLYTTTMQAAYHRWVIGPSLDRSFRAADVLTTHSLFTARALYAAGVEPRARVIPLWADYTAFSPSPHKIVASGPFKLLFVGNRSRRKGADVVDRLAKLLGPSVEIACTGGLRGGKVADAPANIRLLGRLSTDGLVEAYRDCDAALVPSRYEGFGYAALEAMACGKPVVGFACGSIEEIVDNGRTGFLRAVDDIDGLRDDVLKLMQDASLRARMGDAARDRAITAFSVDAGVASYVEAYRDAMSRRGRH